jgi:hypothetical protein
MDRLIYWAATGVLSVIYIGGGIFYLTNMSAVQDMYAVFGFPSWLVPVLGTLKLLGVAAIVSRLNVPLSDLAYAGMFFHLFLAICTHIGNGDPVTALMPAVVAMVALVTSFLSQNTARNKPSPYVSVAALRGPAI